jgi:hypothetical protein
MYQATKQSGVLMVRAIFPTLTKSSDSAQVMHGAVKKWHCIAVHNQSIIQKICDLKKKFLNYGCCYSIGKKCAPNTADVRGEPHIHLQYAHDIFCRKKINLLLRKVHICCINNRFCYVIFNSHMFNAPRFNSEKDVSLKLLFF